METDGGVPISRFGRYAASSSDRDICSSDDNSPGRLTASQKGKGRADRADGPGFLSTPRTRTFSTASSASSVGYPRTRSPAPPVPSLPAAYASPKAKPSLKVELSAQEPSTIVLDTGLGPAPNAAEPLVIAVVGAAGCGKSEFTWKGMKAWGMDPEESLYDFDGIQCTSFDCALCSMLNTYHSALSDCSTRRSIHYIPIK